jgi:tRNA uridine 5-carboxymethylaminomethyl modification enzyme
LSGLRQLCVASRRYDVVVIGGGHAGCEAAAAACRVGARTLLVTQRIDTIGVMSCNPSIGGVGKGTLVREVDALGGLMGRVADAAGIQFRMLNRSKGEAVWGPRCQADRVLYQSAMHAIVTDELRASHGLELLEASVEDLELEEGASGEEQRLTGVRLADGRLVRTESVVITTGTFLRARLLLGDSATDGGRLGERPSGGIARTFERLGVQLARLKTGTPPRLDGRSIDWTRLAEQPGDVSPEPFSFANDAVAHAGAQLACHMTHTTEVTHAIVRDAQHLAPAYEGAEPRYCPSIDSKVRRFPEKASHQVWLEPEGFARHTTVVYPNGISTALPSAVQRALVRSITGLERCELVQPGYAVEYDYVLPTQLDGCLRLRKARGVFLAGQINGTTGYEEAAAQGLLGGANAALAALGRPPLLLARDEALTGVLVDDLITRGVTEPYRMFTSRAESRLSLRADNADLRLTARALDVGLLDERRDSARLGRFHARARALADAEASLRAISRSPEQWASLGVFVSRNGVARSGWQVVGSARDEARGLLERLRGAGYAVPRLAAPIERQLCVDARYDPYIRRLKVQSNDLHLHGHRLPLPSDLDYSAMRELSNEERERLERTRPSSIGGAAALEGMTATGVSVLLRHARRAQSLKAKEASSGS